MAEVGVRELKARLSEYLRRAQAGERVVVTERGRAVATLGPAQEDRTAHPAWLVQLVVEGGVRLGGRGKPIGSHPRVKLKGGASVSRAVIEDCR